MLRGAARFSRLHLSLYLPRGEIKPPRNRMLELGHGPGL
jgi:hypothetical protein